MCVFLLLVILVLDDLCYDTCGYAAYDHYARNNEQGDRELFARCRVKCT